jgi:hypothetical protein
LRVRVRVKVGLTPSPSPFLEKKVKNLAFRYVLVVFRKDFNQIELEGRAHNASSLVTKTLLKTDENFV